MKILFIGDIVGKPGRDAALALVPELRREFGIDLAIANAENVAGGWGITPPLARALLCGGLDVLTMGNHTWAKEDGLEVIADDPRLLRPANYPPGAPGRGCGLFRTASGITVGVANLNGRVFMEPLDDPFRAADEIIAQLKPQAQVLFFDFHAETTSEKQAFGWHCAGRVSAVVGTHTHVPTADERILPGGTAFVTDVGMCGPENSVIGMDVETCLRRFRTQLPYRHRVAEGSAILNGVVIEVEEATGEARGIVRVTRRN
ncbi:MAG: TIGR00282 family metallophosphoesterase [Capsulimonadales bacterium]|nr:TIGR00282 family metallophosphoesterase [Capsulimonadales bacterium]